MTYSTPHNGDIEEIEFERVPSTLGENRDIKGNLWDIYGVYCFHGKHFIHARLLESGRSTSNQIGTFGRGFDMKTYIPFKIKINEE